MTRTREWMKFGFLVGVTVVLAVAFAAVVRAPHSSEAQVRPVVLSTTTNPAIPAAQPAANLGDAFVAVAEAVRPAVVFIESESEREPSARSPFGDLFPNGPETRRGSGSGFIISTDGYIMTNEHVVENATRITVRLLDRRQFAAEVVGTDPNTDIAIIKIDADDLTAAPLGTSENVRIGEWALAVGNPLGEDFSFTVTAGIVSGRGRRLDNLRRGVPEYSIHDFIQTDAAINPGNSGGPLVNIRGEVIGVNAAIASQTGTYTGYGFAIPIDLARHASEQLIAKGYVTRAALGVSINDATAIDAEYVGLDHIYGVRVENLQDDSPAGRAGIQPGDIIIAVDGKPAAYTAQLQQEIGFRKPGEVVKVTVARKDGVRQTFDVRLQEAEAARPETVAHNTTRRPEESGRFEEVLGISVQELTPQDAVQRGAPRGVADDLAGLVVVNVDPEGPARDNLLRPGEIITRVNGERVRTEDDFRDVLSKLNPGEILTMEISGLNRDNVVQTRIVRMRAGTS